jgi:hypothetical protein
MGKKLSRAYVEVCIYASNINLLCLSAAISIEGAFNMASVKQ